jgi:hypothetical protein
MGTMKRETKSLMEMLLEMQREARENHTLMQLEIYDSRVIFYEWRPLVEHQVTHLQGAVHDLQN